METGSKSLIGQVASKNDQLKKI